MQRQCFCYILTICSHSHSAQHRLRLLIMESFCRQCLKIVKITSFETHFTWFFPWETADEYLHQGKGGKIQTIVRFSVKTLIILNLVSWNGLHRSNIFKMIVCWEYTVRDYYIGARIHRIGFLWISCCPHQEIHFKITFHYTRIVKLIPTYAAVNNVHLFEVEVPQTLFSTIFIDDTVWTYFLYTSTWTQDIYAGQLKRPLLIKLAVDPYHNRKWKKTKLKSLPHTCTKSNIKLLWNEKIATTKMAWMSVWLVVLLMRCDRQKALLTPPAEIWTSL